MKHFLSALALGCLLLSCNRDLENNESPTPAPQEEKLVLLKELAGGQGWALFGYKNRNEIESLSAEGGFRGKSDIDYEYDAYGRIVKEHRYWHNYGDGETNITYQYDSQGRLVSSHAISTKNEEYPGTGLPPTPLCSIERKHTYTYQGNKVIVKIERGADNCSSTPEAAKEKTITLFVENGRVVKSFDENNQIIETIEYRNTKNALRNIKGFPALVAEFYIRPLTYELPYYNFIESINDFRFIDNIKTRDFHDGSYWEYYYSVRTDMKIHEKDYDHIENVAIVEKLHNDPTYDDHIWMLNASRYYIKEK